MDPYEKAADLLEELYLRYGDFQLNKLGEDTALWDSWKYYTEIKSIPAAQPTDREVLEPEIVIDFDYEEKDRVGNVRTNLRFAFAISHRLQKHDLPHSVWRSGGKGAHIHLFMDPSEAALLAGDDMLRDFKVWFIRELVPDGMIDDGWIDLDPVNKSQSMVQLEYVPHRKGTGRKLQRGGDHLTEVSLFTEYIDEFLNKSDPVTLDPEPSSYTGGEENDFSALDHDVIQYCLNNEVTDCRKRLLFFAVSHLAWSEPREKTEKVMHDLNQQFSDEGKDVHVPERRVTSMIESAYEKKEQGEPKPPSNEWILERIQNCSDEDLQEFAEGWAAEYDIGGGS